MLFRKAAAGRSARLDGLEFLPVLDTSTYVVDDFTQRGSHRNFDETYVVDFAGKGEHLGTLGLLGTDGSEPFRSLGQDDRDVGKGLDVVDVRRFTEVTGLCRERWLQSRLSALSFHGMDEGCLFSADECSSTVADLYVEVESGSEDILAQETIFPGLLQGDLEPVDGEWILSPDIDKTVVRADAVTADGHGFEDGVRVAFHDGTVHESSRVSFVGVADDIFRVILICAAEFPFLSGREACASATAKSGSLDHSDHFLRSLVENHVRKGGVSIPGDIFFYVFRVDETAVPEGYSNLLSIEVHVLGIADVLLGLRIYVEEPFDLAPCDDVFGYYFFSIRRFHLGVESVVWNDFDDRAFLAEAETAGSDDIDFVTDAVLFEGCLEVLYDQSAFGSLAAGTSAASIKSVFFPSSAKDLQMSGTFLDSAAFLRDESVALLPEFQRLLRSFLDGRQVIDG